MTLFNLFTGIVAPVIFSFVSEKIQIPATENDLTHEAVETSEYIPWSYSRMLTWEDFQCEPNRDSDQVALTSTLLSISYKYEGGNFSYQISCLFSKKKSWVILKSPYILKHEQAHFDISEIFARRLNQLISEYKPTSSTLKNDIAAIYQNIIREERAFQELYDSETNHSRNRVQQQVWLEKIKYLLNNSEAYADYQ